LLALLTSLIHTSAHPDHLPVTAGAA
jgi:hypothetical protein